MHMKQTFRIILSVYFCSKFVIGRSVSLCCYPVGIKLMGTFQKSVHGYPECLHKVSVCYDLAEVSEDELRSF